MESGHPAGTGTLKSLAAAFEVDSSTLNPEQTMTSKADISIDRQEKEAFRQVRTLRGFYPHVIRYLIVALALLAINLIVSPRRMWVFWVMGGWGPGILMHAFRGFRSDGLRGPRWERRQVEKGLGRSI
ncbi:MAG: 2TM domain-containing protein [Betaproteobacteria bacterium]|nr:2TM domain-containing protein [Betaproteobacteria bacterium]